MMTSDSGESRREAMRPHGVTCIPPTSEQQEQFPCPRCDSTNTKFCYYNNYNFSQPRHFCKSCRRYWTHGGTLRDIPIGGGSRKAAKRTRTCSSSATSAVNSVVSTSAGISSVPLQATPVLFPPSSISNGVSHTVTPPLENDTKGIALSRCGSFTSLLNHNTNAATATHGSGSVIGLDGFGIGLGSGFDDVSFGLGRAVWPFSTVGDAATTNIGSNGGHHAVPIPATWQFEGLESSNAGRFVSGEYFAWPELSITTTSGNSLK